MVVNLANLTSAVVVCRDVKAMNGTEWLVSEFLDASVWWSMRSACERCPHNGVRLLERVAVREDPQTDSLLKRANFTVGLDKAAERGDFEATKWFVETYLPAGRIRSPVRTAVKHSRLDILKWLRANHNERVVWDISAVLTVEAVDLETLKWVHENVLPIDYELKDKLMDFAGHYQLVDRVAWLHSLDLPFVLPQLSVVINTGSIAMIEWISDHANVQFYNHYLEQAVRFGQIALAQWLSNNYGFYLVSDGAVVDGIQRLSLSAVPGDFHVIHEFLDWVLEHLTISRIHQLATLINDFAKLGDLEGVKKIHKVSGLGVCSTNAMDAAAANGRLDMVKWFHENRSEGCTSAAMDFAARNGHLEVVMWLSKHRTEGCTSAAMDDAAENGHLEVVKWLSKHRREGRIGTKDALYGAAENGHLDTLRWLHEHRVEGCPASTINRAAENGHLSVVTWLHEHWRNVCTTDLMDGAARYGHLDVVKFLHNSRSEGCSSRALADAASNGHLETVKWLNENRIEASKNSEMHYATQSHQFEVMQWLHQRTISGKAYLKFSEDSKPNLYIQDAAWSNEQANADVAVSVMKVAVEEWTTDEICWLLQRLPDYHFGSAFMFSAMCLNKLDIAMLLAKDDRFTCDLGCIRQAVHLRHVEVFQWFVRDISSSIPESGAFIEKTVLNNLFMRDALDELEHLQRTAS